MASRGKLSTLFKRGRSDEAHSVSHFHVNFTFIFYLFNPYLTNGFSHHYQLKESKFIFRGVRSDF